jgi:hypothetical protein
LIRVPKRKQPQDKPKFIATSDDEEEDFREDAEEYQQVAAEWVNSTVFVINQHIIRMKKLVRKTRKH